MSFITSSMREKVSGSISTSLRVNWTELQTNLVPLPRVHFIVPALAPLISVELSHYTQPRVDQTINFALKPDSQLAHGDLFPNGYDRHRLLGCCMLFKGESNPMEINTTLQKVKRTRSLQFVKYVGHGIKLGIFPNRQTVLKRSEMPKLARSMCMLTNSSSIRRMWRKMNHTFDMLYGKSAFIHHYYEEGLEMDEFLDARYNLAMLEKDYEEILADMWH